MGRQTQFYISSETKNQFLDFVFSEGYRVFSEKYECDKGIHSIEHFDCSTINDWLLLFYKDFYGDLIFNQKQRGRIDKLYSPVVEFIDSTVHNEKRYISSGRIWLSGLNDFKDDASRKSFLSDYKKLVGWIRKNVPRREFFNGTILTKGYIDDTMKKKYENKYSFK